MFRHAETAYLQKCSLLLLNSLRGILNRGALKQITHPICTACPPPPPPYPPPPQPPATTSSRQSTSLSVLVPAEAGSSDINSQTLRGFTYQALGMLASRVPEPFREDVDAAAGFFAALSSEPPGVRASLQEAVSTLATAYKGCSGKHWEGCCLIPLHDDMSQGPLDRCLLGLHITYSMAGAWTAQDLLCRQCAADK